MKHVMIRARSISNPAGSWGSPRADVAAPRAAAGIARKLVLLAAAAFLVLAGSRCKSERPMRSIPDVALRPDAAPPNAVGGPARIWDTLVSEAGNDDFAYQESFQNSWSWSNRAHWRQVPYGTTDYEFVGDVVVENGNFWLFLHSSGDDDPILYLNFDGWPGVAHEIYSYRMIPGDEWWGYGSRNRLWTAIVRNAPDEVVVDNYANSIPWTPPDEMAVTRYVVKETSHYVTILPGTSETFWEGGHSPTNRFAVAPANDGSGNDFVIDPREVEPTSADTPNRHDHGDGSFETAWYLPPANNGFMFQEVQIDNTQSIVFMSYDDPVFAQPRIGTRINSLGEIRLESIRANMRSGASNPVVYYGGINQRDIVFHEPDDSFYGSEHPLLNRAMSSGERYVASVRPTFPGMWRVTGRIRNGSGVNCYTNTVEIHDAGVDRLFFACPVAGTLEIVVMYLYDRTPETPSDVITIMDAYRQTRRP